MCRFLLKPSKLEEIEEALAVMAENLKKKKGVASHEESQEENSAGSFIVKKMPLLIWKSITMRKLTLALVAEKNLCKPVAFE